MQTNKKRCHCDEEISAPEALLLEVYPASFGGFFVLHTTIPGAELIGSGPRRSHSGLRFGSLLYVMVYLKVRYARCLKVCIRLVVLF